MTTPSRAPALIWLLFLPLWLLLPGVLPLMTPDEGRYAEIAREMLASGDWITPHLNGFLYFEKPPLQYWATAVAFDLFGYREWAARLWSALGFVICLLAIAHTARKLWGERAAQASMLVFASSLYPLALGQVNTLDSGTAAWLTVALCAFLLAFRDGAEARERRRAMLACWAAMALAVLSKGLIGLLIPGTVLALYVLGTRQWRLLAQLEWLKGPLVFLAIAAPWFVVVSMRNPDFAKFFFVHEHFQRYLTDEAHREGHRLYFVALLAIGALPWTLLVPGVLVRGMRETGAAFRPRLLLAIWVLFVLAFFSVSQSKLPGYLTPLFPALAMLLGERLSLTHNWGQRRIVDESRVIPNSSLTPFILPALVTATVLWTVLLAASFFPGRIHSRSLEPERIALLAQGARWAALAALAGVAAAWVLLKRAPLLPLAAGSSAGFLLLIAFMGPYAYARSSLELVTAAKGDLDGASQVYSVGFYDQTLPFYLGRTVRLVNFTNEFEFGQARDPARAVPTWDAFLKEWQQEARPVAVTSVSQYRALVQRGLPMKLLYSDPVEVVVTKP